MQWLTDPQAWIALLTLTVLEIVLGIDNIIFISILCGKLPAAQQAKARRIGLGLAMVTRILLLLSISWVIRLTQPLFSLLGREISGRDLMLLDGRPLPAGQEHDGDPRQARGRRGRSRAPRGGPSFASVLIQIMLLDIVFSLDSVITAVGMVSQIG